jgi:hypothetical protein
LHKWIKPFFVNGLALIRRTPVNCNIKEKHKDTKTCPALDDLLLSFVLTQSFFDEPNVKSNCLILRAWRRSQPKAQEGRFGEISAKAHFYINIIKMILFTSVHILLFVHTHTHTINDDFLKCFQVIKLNTSKPIVFLGIGREA